MPLLLILLVGSVVPAFAQDLFLASHVSERRSAEQAVVLNNGLSMPIIAASLPFGSTNITDTIAIAWGAGITHFLTAELYKDQAEVGNGLRKLGVPRDAYFVTTMTAPCQCDLTYPPCSRNITDLEECYKKTQQELDADLEELGLDYVDLVLLHAPNEGQGNTGSCSKTGCAANQAQWKAYSEFLATGKAKAIGVSNFCGSCLECLLADDAAVVPAVNQIQYHIAMGPDSDGVMSASATHGIVVQAYEPLAEGHLAGDATCVQVGAAHNRSAAQVAMRWVLQNKLASKSGVGLITTSENPAHLEEDLDIFSWKISDEEMSTLDTITCDQHPEYCHVGGGHPSWNCGL